MFSGWIKKIKNWGIGAVIDGLDNIEKPLGDHIQNSIDEFRKLDGHGLAKMVIDQIQSLLRAYFKLPSKENTPPNLIRKL